MKPGGVVSSAALRDPVASCWRERMIAESTVAKPRS